MKFDAKKVFWMFRALVNAPFFNHIGMLSYLGKPISILGRQNIYLGKNVHIYPGARIESYNNGKIIIKDNVSISENVHIVAGGGALIIESGTLIGPNVFISNSDHQYRDISKRMMQQELIVRNVEIGADNYLGVGVAVLPGTKTGRHSVIGSNSIVNGSHDGYSVLVGSPAKVIRRYNEKKQEWEKVDGRY